MSLFRRTVPGYRTQAILLGALTALAPLSIDMYLPALPTLAEVMTATSAEVQYTLASFFLAYALGQLFWGPISDRYGRKAPLYAALLLYVIASFACAWASSIEQLIFFRFLQALGACAGAVISRAIVRDQYDGVEAARLFAAMMLVMGVAPMVAPIIGGQLLTHAGWSWIFVLLAVIGIVVVLALHLRLTESHLPEKRRAISVGVVMRNYGELLREPRFIGLALVGSFAMGSLYGYIAGAAFVFMQAYALSPTQFAWLFGFNAFWFILATQINSRLLSWRPSAWLLPRALALQVFSGVLLVLITATGWGGVWAFLLVLYGFTISLGFILPNATVLVLSPFPDRAGTASALYGMLQSTLGAFAALLLALLPDDARWSMAGVMLVCALFSCWGWWRFRPMAPTHPSRAA